MAKFEFLNFFFVFFPFKIALSGFNLFFFPKGSNKFLVINFIADNKCLLLFSLFVKILLSNGAVSLFKVTEL